jgi:hypothetical protein
MIDLEFPTISPFSRPILFAKLLHKKPNTNDDSVSANKSNNRFLFGLTPCLATRRFRRENSAMNGDEPYEPAE